MIRPVEVSLLSSLAVMAIACASPEEATSVRPPEPRFDLSTARLVDLSYSFDSETVYWPTAPHEFELEQLSYGPTEAGFFYAANAFAAPEHGGTHLDAPIHFSERKRTTEEIPLDTLIGPAVVIDVAAQAAADSDYRLQLEEVQSWEERNGPVPEGAVVLLRTGWGEHWPDRKAFLGDDTPGDATNLHFPSYGAEAARLLVEERRVAVLGVDTASIDYGPSTDFIVHQIANGANVPGLENVANLEQMPEIGAWVVALPMKIAGGSGGPVRIVGLIWD